MKIIGNTFGWTIFNHSLLLTAFVFCKFVFVYQIYDLGVASSFLLQQITFPLLTIVVTVLGFIGQPFAVEFNFWAVVSALMTPVVVANIVNKKVANLTIRPAKIILKNTIRRGTIICVALVSISTLCWLLTINFVPYRDIKFDLFIDFAVMIVCALGAALWTMRDFRLGLKPAESDDETQGASSVPSA